MEETKAVESGPDFARMVEQMRAPAVGLASAVGITGAMMLVLGGMVLPVIVGVVLGIVIGVSVSKS